MIHQDDGTSDAKLSFRTGGNDTSISVPANTNGLVFDFENQSGGFAFDTSGRITTPITASSNISASGFFSGSTLNLFTADNQVAVFESTDANANIVIKDNNAETKLVHSLHAFKIQVDPSDVDGSSNFRIEIDGDEALRIKNNLNVGIGTTTPTSKLSVSGSIDFAPSGSISFVENLSIESESTTTIATIDDQGIYKGIFYDYVIKYSDTGNLRAGTVTAVYFNELIQFTDVSTVSIGDSSQATFDVTYTNGVGILLKVTVGDIGSEVQVKGILKVV